MPRQLIEPHKDEDHSAICTRQNQKMASPRPVVGRQRVGALKRPEIHGHHCATSNGGRPTAATSFSWRRPRFSVRIWAFGSKPGSRTTGITAKCMSR